MLRLALLACLLALSACATSPQALGLTGAAPPAAPRPHSDATVGLPGLPDPAGTAGRYYGQP
ncbi:MAG: hypothetical protein ACP5NP_14395 [Acetobacteraceae bacterium]